MASRHQLREIAMTSLYQSLLLKKDIKQCVYENNGNSNKIDPFLYTITIDAYENIGYYKKQINGLLKENWEFDRLNYVEQAILIIAASEIHFQTVSKAIVIDEAVMLAKKYCDEDSYKFINGVLDRL